MLSIDTIINKLSNNNIIIEDIKSNDNNIIEDIKSNDNNISLKETYLNNDNFKTNELPINVTKLLNNNMFTLKNILLKKDTFIYSILSILDNLFIYLPKDDIENKINKTRKFLCYILDEDKLHKKLNYTYLKKFKKSNIQDILLKYKETIDNKEEIKKYIVDYLGINIYIIDINNNINIIYSTNDCNNFLKIKPSILLLNNNNIYYPIMKDDNSSIFLYSNTEDNIIINKLIKESNHKIEEHNSNIISINNIEYDIKKLKKLKIIDIKKLCNIQEIDLKKKSNKTNNFIFKSKMELINELLK
jgi:hypothetical protein